MNAARWSPNVTVAAVIEDGGRYLLVQERTPEGLKLNNPAGHLDPGETPLQGAMREALEETAREFMPEALLGIYLSRFQRPATGQDVTYLRIAFCGRAGEPIAGRALDAPVVQTLWLTPQQIEHRRDEWRSPLVGRCIDDHRAGRRHSLALVQTDASVFEPEIKR